MTLRQVVLDTETTGLYWHKENVPFLIVLASPTFRPFCVDVATVWTVATMMQNARG